MKIKFLGTAAAEGWPAVFCTCENCRKAERLGGRDIRTRSQILVNDDLLVDLPPDTYLHKLAYGLDLSAVNTLLVTHSHMDHFYPMELSMRGGCYALGMKSETLNIFSDAHVKHSFDLQSGFEKFLDAVDGALRWNLMHPFDRASSGRYEIYALKARHTHPEQSLFYLVKEGDRAFLQCNDTGYLYEENFEFLEKTGVKIDAVALDCTCGKIRVGETGTHMGAPDCADLVARMRKCGFLKENARFVVTHFSHNGGMTHAELTDYFAPLGVDVAFDGFEMSI